MITTNTTMTAQRLRRSETSTPALRTERALGFRLSTTHRTGTTFAGLGSVVGADKRWGGAGRSGAGLRPDQVAPVRTSTPSTVLDHVRPGRSPI